MRETDRHMGEKEGSRARGEREREKDRNEKAGTGTGKTVRTRVHGGKEGRVGVGRGRELTVQCS